MAARLVRVVQALRATVGAQRGDARHEWRLVAQPLFGVFLFFL